MDKELSSEDVEAELLYGHLNAKTIKHFIKTYEQRIKDKDQKINLLERENNELKVQNSTLLNRNEKLFYEIFNKQFAEKLDKIFSKK